MKAIWRRRRRRRWRPATDTKKVTIRNSSASDGARGIYTTRCNTRGENVFGPLSMKITGAEPVKSRERQKPVLAT